jgi:hypothetical protein
VLDRASHTPRALRSNRFQNEHGCRALVLTAGVDVLEVLGDRSLLHVEQPRHLILGEPHGLSVEPHFQRAALGLVERDAGALSGVVAHAVLLWTLADGTEGAQRRSAFDGPCLSTAHAAMAAIA